MGRNQNQSLRQRKAPPKIDPKTKKPIVEEEKEPEEEKPPEKNYN